MNLEDYLNEEPEAVDELIAGIAEKIAQRRLEMPAVLMLEMHKPVHFLISQAALVTIPMLGPLMGADNIARFCKLISKRENIDLLISRIEEMSDIRDAAEGGRA